MNLEVQGFGDKRYQFGSSYFGTNVAAANCSAVSATRRPPAQYLHYKLHDRNAESLNAEARALL